MASLILGGLVASREVYKYNRQSFFFDQTIRQVREFQYQGLRMEQFGLYREDVRDLVELTVGKMDLYLIAAALLADRTMVMICKQSEAFPRWSPDWAVTLNALSLASGVFYLLLALWLAMYASISAQSFGTRLLTQFVRLPYASQEQLDAATARGIEYEERGLREMLRVPLLPTVAGTVAGGQPAAAGSTAAGGAGRAAAPVAQAGAPAPAASSGAGAASEAAGPEETGVDGVEASDYAPSAMLEHIKLYRKVQLNWQAHDAYARVSLFVGASSLLYSCLYWSLGQFLNHAVDWPPAIFVALIFATVQIVLCNLDLRLRKQYRIFITIVLMATPLITTLGILIDRHIQQKGEPRSVIWDVLEGVLATLAHGLHALVMGLVLLASWPDPPTDGGAVLPGKFASALYLDVFGWLLNPSVVGATRGNGSQRQPVAGGPRRDGNQVRQGAPERRPGVPEERRVDFDPELRMEANRLLNPDFQPHRRSLPEADRGGEERWGGRESVPVEEIERTSLPTAGNPTTFTSMPPRRLPRKINPQVVPWLAFKNGTVAILVVWVVSTGLTFWKALAGDLEGGHGGDLIPVFLATAGSPAASWLHETACGAAAHREAAASFLERLRRQPGPARGRCSLRQPLEDVSAGCEGDDARRCTLTLLHQGGRAATVCTFSISAQRLSLLRAASLRLAPNAVALRKAVAGRLQPRGSLWVVGRTRSGALLGYRRLPSSSDSAARVLVPSLEFEPEERGADGPVALFYEAAALADEPPSWAAEDLHLLPGGLLLSVRLREQEQAVADGARRCAAGADLALGGTARVWAPLSGRSAALHLPEVPGGGVQRDVLRDLCAGSTAARSPSTAPPRLPAERPQRPGPGLGLARATS